MVNEDIFKIADQLRNVVDQQKEQARKALLSLPEGETKRRLTDLLRQATSGKISHVDAQKEIQKIVADANTN